MKNLLIHVADAVHAQLFRHRLGSCDTLARSDWWACDRTDRYCRTLAPGADGEVQTMP